MGDRSQVAFPEFTVPAVIAAAAVDAVNPCACGVLVLLGIAMLVLVGFGYM